MAALLAPEAGDLDFDDPDLGQELVKEARWGSCERVQALLDQGVDVDSRDISDKSTGLIRASARGHVAIVTLLCERGASVCAANRGGSTAVIEASRHGHLDVVEFLHARGADIHRQDDGGKRALHHGTVHDHLPVCEFLLSKGADLLAVDYYGWTALSFYGQSVFPRLSPETKALHRAALEAAWAAGPHPSQARRRRDERWFRRGPLLWVLAEHAYRPLQHRALAIALAAASLDPAAPIEAVALTTKEQRHAFLLGRVFSNEGIVRLLVALL